MNNINYPAPKQEYKVLVRCFTYNHREYIEDALNGFAMQQTNFPFVCFVMDDASPDGEQEVIKAWIERECDMSKVEFIDILTSHVIIVPHKSNLSCTFAFYLLKQNLHGTGDKKMNHVYPWRKMCEYEALCEGDDYWIDSLKLQKQVDFLDTHKNYGLVFTDVNCYYQESGQIKEKCFSSGLISVSKSFIEHLYNAGFIAPCSWLYRIELLNLKDSKKYVDGTFPFALDVWANTNIYYMKEVTTVYRVLPNSASHSTSLRKRYNFSKGLFQIKKDYINKYKNLLSEQDEFNINKRAFVMLSKSAIALSDNKFLEEAELFFKSNCLYHYYLFLKLRFIFPLKALSIHIYKKKGFHI